MEPVTIVIVSYSITIVTTIVSSYYVSSYLGDKVYDEIGKLRSVLGSNSLPFVFFWCEMEGRFCDGTVLKLLSSRNTPVPSAAVFKTGKKKKNEEPCIHKPKNVLDDLGSYLQEVRVTKRPKKLRGAT